MTLWNHSSYRHHHPWLQAREEPMSGNKFFYFLFRVFSLRFLHESVISCIQGDTYIWPEKKSEYIFLIWLLASEPKMDAKITNYLIGTLRQWSRWIVDPERRGPDQWMMHLTLWTQVRAEGLNDEQINTVFLYGVIYCHRRRTDGMIVSMPTIIDLRCQLFPIFLRSECQNQQGAHQNRATETFVRQWATAWRALIHKFKTSTRFQWSNELIQAMAAVLDGHNSQEKNQFEAQYMCQSVISWPSFIHW